MIRHSPLFVENIRTLVENNFNRDRGPISLLPDKEIDQHISDHFQPIPQKQTVMKTQLETSAEMTESYAASIPCGQQKDSTLSFQSTANSRFSYAYDVSWEWALVYNALSIPDSFELHFAANGNYETLRMASEDESVYDFTMNGLKLSAPDLIYNGSTSAHQLIFLLPAFC